MSSSSYFKDLRNSIMESIFEDSENGIQNVIQSLAWNDSVYRTFNEGLRLARNPSQRAKIPKSLVEYIHRAYTSDVVITLRKLYDDKKEGTRAVNSLRTITHKILDNQHLFIRENYVAYDGSPYDDSDNLDWKTKAIVQGRHRQFDLLCNLAPGAVRKKSDKVDPIIPARLHRWTVLRSEIDAFANKFLAHSSAKSNRPDEKLTFERLLLSRIETQYKNVIWSSQQIGKFLCEAVLTEVPTPQFDVLAEWENGIFDTSIKIKLHTYWYRRMAWWRKWTDHYRDFQRVFLSPGHKGMGGI